MKEGRLRVNPPYPDVIRTVDVVWNQLDTFQKAALFNGFGENLSKRFYGASPNLTDETGEVTGFLAKIIERV